MDVGQREMSMPHESRKHHKNGKRVHVLPTEDRLGHQRPDNMRAKLVNTPNYCVYFVALLFIMLGIIFLAVGGAFAKPEKCLVQPFVSIWLLLMGIIITGGGVWFGVYVDALKKEPFKRTTSLQRIITYILLIAFLAWFIAGHVWVYGAWKVEPDLSHYWFENACNKSLFLLAFIAMIALDVLVGVGLIGLCLWGLTHVIVKE